MAIGVRTGAKELVARARSVEFYDTSDSSGVPHYVDACFLNASGTKGMLLLLGADGASLWVRPIDETYAED